FPIPNPDVGDVLIGSIGFDLRGVQVNSSSELPKEYTLDLLPESDRRYAAEDPPDALLSSFLQAAKVSLCLRRSSNYLYKNEAYDRVFGIEGIPSMGKIPEWIRAYYEEESEAVPANRLRFIRDDNYLRHKIPTLEPEKVPPRMILRVPVLD